MKLLTVSVAFVVNHRLVTVRQGQVSLFMSSCNPVKGVVSVVYTHNTPLSSTQRTQVLHTMVASL